jgi:hypothetical protein
MHLPAATNFEMPRLIKGVVARSLFLRRRASHGERFFQITMRPGNVQPEVAEVLEAAEVHHHRGTETEELVLSSVPLW